MQDLLAVGDALGDRTDEYAGAEIAEDSAEAAPLEDWCGDHCAAEQHQRLRIDDRCRCHACGFHYWAPGPDEGAFESGHLRCMGGNQADALDACVTAQ
ncbi:hypothetical protein D9M70_507670 [compost metagenome]